MFTSDVRPDGAMNEAGLRLWAREHYVPLPDRSLSWPGFVLDEMRRMDEASKTLESRVDRGQPAFGPPNLLLRVGKIVASKLPTRLAEM